MRIMIKRIAEDPYTSSGFAHATGKVFLDGNIEVCDPLRPEEVVELPDELGKTLLKSLPFQLEMTEEPANRPYYKDGSTADFNRDAVTQRTTTDNVYAELSEKEREELTKTHNEWLRKNRPDILRNRQPVRESIKEVDVPPIPQTPNTPEARAQQQKAVKSVRTGKPQRAERR